MMSLITASEGPQVGVGYDTRFGELRADVLNAQKQSLTSLNDSEASFTEFSVRSVSSKAELIEALNQDENLSLPWLVANPPPALRWALNTRFDPTCVYVVIKAEIKYPLRSFNQPAVEAERLEKMKSLSKADFLELYGDTYVSGYREGGLLQGIVKIRFESLDEKSNLEEIFSTDLEVTSIDEAFNDRLNQLMGSHETGVTLFKTGRLDNFTAQIDDFLVNLRLYALEVKEFNWVTHMLIKDYGTLEISKLSDQQSKLDTDKELLRKLGRLYIQNQVQMSSVEFVLAHLYDHHNGQGVVFEEYEDFNEEELKAKEQVWKEVQKGLRNNIDLLREHCQSMQQSRICQGLKKELFTMSETIPKIKTKNRALEQLNIALQKTSDNLQSQITQNQGQINQRAMVQMGSFYKDWHDSTFRPLARTKRHRYEAVYWVPFHWCFPRKPSVTCALSHIDSDHRHNLRLDVYPKDVHPHGFHVCCMSWDDALIYAVKLTWVAVC